MKDNNSIKLQCGHRFHKAVSNKIVFLHCTCCMYACMYLCTFVYVHMYVCMYVCSYVCVLRMYVHALCIIVAYIVYQFVVQGAEHLSNLS